ncbi:kinase [Alteromonas sp. ASW11-130]|uniref:kinase n=1 Tax=Alteromonas sp. ASW11-130 TaxID=3015775 RepID=UPI002242389E|nr:kinase [Alteromonas sp. ASW11-130]MCW8092437.1 kinase [Alteromonas sp. ASW11-130]
MDLSGFLARHQLPETYREVAQKWFVPLAESIMLQLKGAGRPFFVGINGCQGSGKSTLTEFLSEYLCTTHQLNVACMSLDDFYLSQIERVDLAETIHPLLRTRGVPGTHDVTLMNNVFTQLKADGEVALPRFNKADDNPFPQETWPVINTPPDIVIVEGWCWGVPPQLEQDLVSPINTLEEAEDSEGIWRRFVNQQLAERYQPLFAQMNYSIMLKGLSFEHVFRWRCEQEHKLAAKTSANSTAIMTDEQIARFIQHYQRLTEHSFQALPPLCDVVFKLDENRNIVHVNTDNKQRKL